jgi:hypothetical protein
MDRLLATGWEPCHDLQVGLLRLLKPEGLL